MTHPWGLPYLYLIFSCTCLPPFFFFFFLNNPAPPDLSPLPHPPPLPLRAPSAGIPPPHPLRSWSRLPDRSPAAPPRSSRDSCRSHRRGAPGVVTGNYPAMIVAVQRAVDRKSTRLKSRHLVISYAVFWLKK